MSDKATSTLEVRLDAKNKRAVEEAAKLRRGGIFEYIRLVLAPTAKREVARAKQQVVQMSADEQERFWQALPQAPAHPTEAQCGLGDIMKGR